MPRVKAILHSVIKPYLSNCPLEDFGICLPVLQVCEYFIVFFSRNRSDKIYVRSFNSLDHGFWDFLSNELYPCNLTVLTVIKVYNKHWFRWHLTQSTNVSLLSGSRFRPGNLFSHPVRFNLNSWNGSNSWFHISDYLEFDNENSWF